MAGRMAQSFIGHFGEKAAFGGMTPRQNVGFIFTPAIGGGLTRKTRNYFRFTARAVITPAMPRESSFHRKEKIRGSIAATGTAPSREILLLAGQAADKTGDTADIQEAITILMAANDHGMA